MSEDTELGANPSVSRRREEKARKKDARSWENIMKTLGDLPTADKLAIIKQKYTVLYSDFRSITNNYAALERKFNLLQRERDQVRADLNKNILAKSKLESLCRELQKQNKAIKDENITRMKEEEEKRREVATIFTERLNSLSSMMDENKDKSFRLREENMNMTIKLTELYTKFQEREDLLANLNRQLDVQKDLFESKIKKMELEYKSNRNIWEEEQKCLLTNLLKSNDTNRLLEENIRSMQANLDVYKNQYSDFEQTMSRSNEVFKTFHGEINKLKKSNTTLEKEKCDYVTKWKSCHNSVVEISEKNQQLVKKLEMTDKKVSTLEKLCRQLQAERNALHKQVQQDKGDPAVVPQEDEPNSNDNPNSKQNDEKLPNGDLKQMHDHRVIDMKAKAQSGGGEGIAEVVPEVEKLISDTASSATEASQSKSVQTFGPDDDMECSDLELDPPGPSTADFASNVDFDYDSDDMEGTIIGIETSSSQGAIYIKETKSAPVTKQELEGLGDDHVGDEEEDMGGELGAELSLGSVPLYKPAAVIDVPTQGGHVTIVRESEGRTNILEPDSSTDLTGESVPSIETDSSSSGTIALKESAGKTELNKE